MTTAREPIKSHALPTCSTAGGATITVCRLRSPFTRPSIVKDCGIDPEKMLVSRLVKGNCLLVILLVSAASLGAQNQRPRARDIGIVVGSIPTGPLNAITDVAGIRVGHTTITRGDSINTGVTAILPHGGNLFREKVSAAIVVGNGFGKLAGSTQVNELGELESPIVLTCTLCVPRAADAVLTYLLGLPGNNDVRSANAVVAETNDGLLNDIRVRAITPEDVLAAIRTASPGAVGEGAVGAGRGTVAFGWKGGIGTASRRLPLELGGW